MTALDELLAASTDNTLVEKAREELAVMQAELERERKLSAHWRKVAYDSAGVTEEEVLAFLEKEAIENHFKEGV